MYNTYRPSQEYTFLLIFFYLIIIPLPINAKNSNIVLISSLDSITFPILKTKLTSAFNIFIDRDLSKWTTKNVLYDPTQSYDSTPGSIKFANTPPSYIISNISIPVKAGEIYTLSARIKSTTTPSTVLTLKGAIKGGTTKAKNLFGSYISNSKANIWEKISVSIKIPDNTTHTQLYIKAVKESHINGTIWIDNIEIRQGVALENRPSKKIFNGSHIKIDTLGNIKVSGKPYFPIIIYGDNKRKLYTYKNQGFNTIAQASTPGGVKRAKDAGMMANFEMSYYVSFHNKIPKYSQTKLKTNLQTIQENNLMDNLLFYYWDNEFYHYNKEINQIVNIIKKIDTVDGKQTHPHYMLAGQYGHTRIYNKFINITGTYTARGLTASSPVTYVGEPLIYNLQMQDYAENQNTPSVIGQFNDGTNEKFRALIFGGIAKGMKGFGYWRDSARGETHLGRILDVTKQVWWDDLPSIASEIQKMLNAGLIQSSHLISFKAIANKPIDKIISGTRLLNNIGYIIIGNTTSKDEKVTFHLQNLGYTPTLVTDFFTGSTTGIISGNSIKITLPAYTSKVLKLIP